MSIKDRDVHGHKVSGEDDAKEGINYLDHDIQYKEAEVFFDQARQKGLAQFEDDQGRNYTLIYNKDGTYRIERRSADSSGWF